MPDAPIGTTLIRREVGRRFLALREEAKLTQEQASVALDRARATIGRIESGEHTVRFRAADVKAMLALYHASEEVSELLLALTAETRNGTSKSWWHDYTATDLPDWFTMYVSLEDGAAIISQYEPELVPGLLQTRAYAQEIMRAPAGFLDEDEAMRRVAARMKRQSLLTRVQAPRLQVVINQAVLQRLLGMGTELAEEQLQHLLEITLQANVEVRMVPWSAGVHGGMASSSGFSLLDFPNGPRKNEPIEPPLAYIDSPTGSMYLGKPTEVRVYRLIWADLISNALDPQATRQVITTALEGLSQ